TATGEPARISHGLLVTSREGRGGMGYLDKGWFACAPEGSVGFCSPSAPRSWTSPSSVGETGCSHRSEHPQARSWIPGVSPGGIASAHSVGEASRFHPWEHLPRPSACSRRLRV